MASGKAAPIYATPNDHTGVIRILNILRSDIDRVTSVKPRLSTDDIPAGGPVVIVGTLENNKIIDKLVASKKAGCESYSGETRSFIIQPVVNVLPGIENALFIIGNDKRGTIYGLLDLSRQIGVSPWHWWADVPIKKKRAYMFHLKNSRWANPLSSIVEYSSTTKRLS